MAVNCPGTPTGSSGLPGETAIDTRRDVRQAERGRAGSAAGRGRDGVTAGDSVARGRDARRAAGARWSPGCPSDAADAPLAGGVNVTRPPATGSFELLAVTVTTSGAANTPEAVWPLPEVTAMVNPLDSKAPISTVPLTMRLNPRWSVVTPAGMRALLPASMAGLPGSRAMVWVGPP